jgi:hypothetical protein
LAHAAASTPSTDVSFQKKKKPNANPFRVLISVSLGEQREKGGEGNEKAMWGLFGDKWMATHMRVSTLFLHTDTHVTRVIIIVTFQMEKFMRVLNNFLPFAIFPAVTRGIKNLLSLYPSLQLKLLFFRKILLSLFGVTVELLNGNK